MSNTVMWRLTEPPKAPKFQDTYFCCLRDPELNFCTQVSDRTMKQQHWACTGQTAADTCENVSLPFAQACYKCGPGWAWRVLNNIYKVFLNLEPFWVMLSQITLGTCKILYDLNRWTYIPLDSTIPLEMGFELHRPVTPAALEGPKNSPLIL